MPANNADFTLDAQINANFDERVALEKAKELAAKLQKELNKGLNITPKLDANVLQRFNQQLDASNSRVQKLDGNVKKLTGDLKTADLAANHLGNTLVSSFNRAGLSKDRFRANLRQLDRELTAAAAKAEALGSANLAASVAGSAVGAKSVASAATSTVAAVATPAVVAAGAVANLQASLAASEKLAASLASVEAVLTEIAATTKGLSAEIAATTAGLGLKDIPVKIIPDLSLFEARLAEVKALPIPVKIFPDLSLFEARLAEVRVLPPIPVKIFPELDLAALKEQSKLLPISVKLFPVLDRIEAQKVVTRLEPLFVTLTPVINKTKLQEQLSRVAPALPPAPPKAPGAGPSSAAATNELQQHPLNTSALEQEFLAKTRARKAETQQFIEENRAFIAALAEQDAAIVETQKSLKEVSQDYLRAAISEQIAEDSAKALVATNQELALSNEELAKSQDVLNRASKRSSLQNAPESIRSPLTPTPPTVPPSLRKRLSDETGAINFSGFTGGLDRIKKSLKDAFGGSATKDIAALEEKIAGATTLLEFAQTGVEEATTQATIAQAQYDKILRSSIATDAEKAAASDRVAASVKAQALAQKELSAAQERVDKLSGQRTTETKTTAPSTSKIATANPLADKKLIETAAAAQTKATATAETLAAARADLAAKTAVLSSQETAYAQLVPLGAAGQAELAKQSKLVAVALIEQADAQRIASAAQKTFNAAGIESAAATKAVQESQDKAAAASQRFGGALNPLRATFNGLKSAVSTLLSPLTALGRFFAGFTPVIRLTDTGLKVGLRKTFKDTAKGAQDLASGMGEAESGMGGAGTAVAGLIAALVVFKAVKFTTGAVAQINELKTSLTGVESSGTKATNALHKQFDNLKLSLGAAASSGVESFTKALTDGVKDLTPSVAEAGAAFGDFIKTIEPLITVVFGALKLIIQGVTLELNALSTDLKLAGDFIKLIVRLGGDLVGFFKDVGKAILDIIPGSKQVLDFLGGIIDLGKKAIGGVVNSVKTAVNGLNASSNAAAAAAQRQADALQRVQDAGAAAVRQMGGLVDADGKVTQGFSKNSQQTLEAAQQLAQAQQVLKEVAANNIPDVGLNAAAAQVLGAQDAVTKDLGARQTELFNKVLSANSALEAQKAASKAVKDAQEELNDAIQKHNKDISDKLLQNTDDLADARQKLADDTIDLADAENKLKEAQKPATADELEQADINLAEARLRLKDATDAAKASQDDLNGSQLHSVNLSGLTLDQVRSVLANARSNLKAQKQGTAVQDETAKKAEDAAKADLERRQAVIDLHKAEQDVLDLKKKGTELDPDVISAKRAVRDATRQQGEDEDRINKLQQARLDLLAPDVEFNKQIAKLTESVKTAKEASAKADQAAAIALASAAGNQQKVNDLLFAQIKANPILLKALQDNILPDDQRLDINRRLGLIIDENTKKLTAQQIAATDAAKAIGLTVTQIEGLQRDTGNILSNTKAIAATPITVNQTIDPNSFFNTLGLGNVAGSLLGTSTADALTAAATAIAAAANRERITEANLAAVARKTGTAQRAFALGGIVDSPTNALIGEAGREAVIPLTNKLRMQSILSHSSVYPQVKAVMDRLDSKGYKPSSGPRIQLADVPRLDLVKSGPSSSARQSKAEAKRERAQWADAVSEAIVNKMVKAGIGIDGGNEFNFTVDQTHPNNQLSERQMRRAVEKAMENKNR